jgi:hypothetical protein
MASNLKDLLVEVVSLVDRAAVRDHANPTEPQRLLFWKAETDRSTMATNAARAAMSDAINALQPHESDPQVGALISKIQAVRGDASSSDRLAKAMLETERLIKSEGDSVTPDVLAKAEQAHKDLQLEYLAQHNPRAAEQYAQLREVG